MEEEIPSQMRLTDEIATAITTHMPWLTFNEWVSISKFTVDDDHGKRFLVTVTEVTE